jgi:hypothetical protein
MGKPPRPHFTGQGISSSTIAILFSDIKAIFRVSCSYSRENKEEGRSHKTMVWAINNILTVEVARYVAVNDDFELRNPVSA